MSGDALNDLAFAHQDLLVGVNGQAVRNSQDLQTVMRSTGIGQPVEVELRARSGHATTQSVTVGVITNYERVVYFLLPFLTGLVFLFVGAWTVWKRMDDQAAQAFSVFSASAAFVLVRSLEQPPAGTFLAAGCGNRRRRPDTLHRFVPQQAETGRTGTLFDLDRLPGRRRAVNLRPAGWLFQQQPLPPG